MKKLFSLLLLASVGTQFCSDAQPLTPEEAVLKSSFFKACLPDGFLEAKVDEVKHFLEHGAQQFINSKDSGGYTALFLAVLRKNDQLAELLIEYGAEVSMPIDDGMTPLMIAIATDNQKMFEKLLAKGADPSIKGPYYLDGCTVLHMAARYRSNDEFDTKKIVTLLLQYSSLSRRSRSSTVTLSHS